MALWLKGHQVETIWNRPARPTDNACVERMQGTTSRWAEVRQARSLEKLQHQLEQVITFQREHYPVKRLCAQTRLEAYPALNKPRRSYDQEHFDAQKAYAYLADVQFVRKVSANGRITVYEHGYQVGKKWSQQKVLVHLDSLTREWIIRDAQGELIRTQQAKQLSPDDIRNLSISRRT